MKVGKSCSSNTFYEEIVHPMTFSLISDGQRVKWRNHVGAHVFDLEVVWRKDVFACVINYNVL